MPRPKKQVAPASEAEELQPEAQPEVPAPDPVEEAAAPQEEQPVPEPAVGKSAGAWSVFSKADEFIRTYSLEIHGSEARALAKQFAKKVKGTVKEA